LAGEVITTAFSHVSTANCLLWGNLQPIFVDIEPNTFCIDPSKIEEAITERTSGILATHVYGFPCQVRQIEKIAEKYNLKVIYDGAHAFGVGVNNQSIFNYGNVSAVSFHATKLYHTVEGGAVITNDETIANKCMLLKNFGLQATVPHLAGTNGKNSEFHAAMGLCNLPKVEDFISKNREISEIYRSSIKHLPLTLPKANDEARYNYTYFPVVFKSAEEMIRVKNELEKAGVYARRYFYPSLNKLSYYREYSCPISESISQRILCLPLYYDLSVAEAETIAAVIIKCYH
jgi:dTDP-4-amino-4,6-dideoxygalactose transaminase